MADDACTERRADGRMAADEAIGRTSGRADGAHEARICGRAKEARTGPRRREQGPACADERMGRQAVKQTGGLGSRGRKSRGRADWADERTEADGRTSSPADGRMGGQADERTSRWAWV